MSVKLTKLGLWKNLVVIIVLTGAVTMVVFIHLMEKWKLTWVYDRDEKLSSTEFEEIDSNASAFTSSILATRLDEKIILRRNPYITDPSCKNFTLSLYEDDTFGITGLVSFPGSGNTWTRHLIQLATGVYTGSYYFDMELFGRGFLGEREMWYSGRTIVQKFHEKYDKRMSIDRAILLIREPFPAILSFANYLEAGHTGKAYQLPYHHKDWPNFLLQSAYNWLSLAKSWMESPVALLVIHYENLRLEPDTTLDKICKFLNHSCPFLMSPCFKKKLEGSFHRSDPPSLGKDRKDVLRIAKYPAMIKNIISRGIDHLNNLITIRGLQPAPLHLYKYYSPENATVHALSYKAS